MLLFTFGEADFEFDASVLVVHVERHQGVARSLYFADESVDFEFVQQQFACAYRVGMNMRGGVLQRADV